MQLSQELDRGARRGSSSSESGTKSMEEQGRQYRTLTAEWESTIEQIRSLSGFEEFLKPPRLSRLINAAQDGPVVTLNVADKQCDALAIIPGFDEVIHIPLPDITSSRVTQLGDELKDLLYSSGVRGERAAQKFTDSYDNEGCQRVLAELWNGIVKSVMDSLAFAVRVLLAVCT
jgi:hypothetical protein